jgi:hypothetical protein
MAMPACVRLYLNVGRRRAGVFSEDCLLANDWPAKTVSWWPSIFCVLAVTWFLLTPVTALGQTEAASKSFTKSSSKTSNSTRSVSSSRASSASSTANAAGRSGTNSAKSKTSSASKASSVKTHSAQHFASTAHRKSSSVASSHVLKGKPRSSKKVARGQQKIDPERAEEIQQALIREHYLTGDPTGKWDQASEDSLRRYQADHGWQSKTVPDSRALISLGLGPNHDHLLNPESAMTTGPEVSHAAAVNPSAPTGPSQSTEPSSASPATPADPPDTEHDASSPQR